MFPNGSTICVHGMIYSSRMLIVMHGLNRRLPDRVLPEAWTALGGRNDVYESGSGHIAGYLRSHDLYRSVFWAEYKHFHRQTP